MRGYAELPGEVADNALGVGAGRAVNHGIKIVRPIGETDALVAMADRRQGRRPLRKRQDALRRNLPDRHRVRRIADLPVAQNSGKARHDAAVPQIGERVERLRFRDADAPRKLRERR